MGNKDTPWKPDQKKVKARVDLLTSAFLLFRNQFYQSVGASHAGSQSGLLMNPALLLESVERYFEDLEKERFENRCGLFNGYRQAAFTLKWFMRLRPVQTHLLLPSALRANENFAMSIAAKMLQIEASEIDPYFYDFFTYTLRYDPLDEGLLMSLCVQLNPALHRNQGETV